MTTAKGKSCWCWVIPPQGTISDRCVSVDDSVTHGNSPMEKQIT